MSDDESCNGFRVSVTDEDVAGWVIAAAAASGSVTWRGLHLQQVVASAVAIGRALGQRIPLEPLDDGLRAAIAGALKHIDGTGYNGLTLNLRRLDAFLQRYPARGIADPPPAPESPA